MTRKDYQAIAAAVNAANTAAASFYTQSPDRHFVAQDAIKQTAENLADILAQDNPRFDRDRFINACFGA